MSQPPATSRSQRLFRSLLRLLPFEFRSDYGGEMELVFQEETADVARREGRTGLLRLWGRTLGGLARTAPREHLEGLRQDLRFALRILRKGPGFVLVAVLSLGLGIGGNTVLFSVVDQVLLRPLPYPEAEELVWVWSSNAARGWARFAVSSQDFDDWRSEAESLSHMAAYSPRAGNLTGGEEPVRVRYVVTTPSLFPLLGVEPLLGRPLLAEEDAPGRGDVAVVSHAFFRSYLGGDPEALGHRLTVDGEGVTVVGVMPPGFGFPDPEIQLYKPFGVDRGSLGSRGARWLDAVGRLAPGVSLEAARAELSTLAERLAREHPDSNTDVGVYLEPLHRAVVGEVRPALLLLWATVGLILLIACANLAGLLLARGVTREREIALRTALGARRPRLLRQLLSESLLLALAGGAAGAALAWGTLRLLPSTEVGAAIPRIEGVGVDLPVLAFCLALSLATGLLFGLLPALTTSRSDPGATLKDGGGRASGRGWRSRGALVVAEVALAAMVLVGAGLLLRSFERLMAVDPGFEPAGLLTLRLEPPQAPLREDLPMEEALARLAADRRQAWELYSRLLKRLDSQPGVRSAAAINRRPLAGFYWNTELFISGRPEPPPGEEPNAFFRSVTPGYFETAGIPLLAGRPLDRRDTADAPGALVIDRTAAEAYWPGENPVGARVTFDGPEDPQRRWHTVVGVVGEVRTSELEAEPRPTLYASFPQSRFGHFGDWGMDLMIRTEGDPLELAGAVRAEIEALAPDLPAFALGSMDQVLSGATAERRLHLLLLGLFAAVALVLAAVGLYGVIAYSVRRRTHEIGIRMALGAAPAAVVGRVVAQGMALVAVGLAVGLAAAALSTRFMASLLYGVGATDPATFAGVGLLLAAVALAACTLPARRAARVDPARAFWGD